MQRREAMDINTITEIARPRQRAELPAWSAGDAWLAGGTWLFSEPQLKVSRLIDIADLGWPALETTEQGLRIAATCKIAELDGMAFPASWIAAPLVNQCCRSFLASFKIWNAATVGGNLCMALPAGPMISLTAALDGVCVDLDAGRKRAARRRSRILSWRHSATRCSRANFFAPLTCRLRRCAAVPRSGKSR